MQDNQIDERHPPPACHSTSDRKAFRMARRSVRGQRSGHTCNAELQIMDELLHPLPKPDYSRWPETKDKRRPWRLPVLSGPHQNKDDDTGQKKSSHQSQKRLSRKHNEDGNNLEFLPISDQALMHEHFLPSSSAVDFPTTFDNFGLCYACFHQRGFHHHYQAPVRVGGGYSVYRHQNPDRTSLSWSTLKWLSEPNNTDVKVSKGSAGLRLGDEYCINLYKDFVDNGGDTSALQLVKDDDWTYNHPQYKFVLQMPFYACEYLESNFSHELLEELKKSGVDVELIAEYTKLYRQHVKELLHSGIKRQSELVKEYDDEVDFAAMYSDIENEGTNMKMLFTALTKGLDDEEILEFERRGGNIEILEHYCDKIDRFARREEIVRSFSTILDNERKHRSAEVFMEFVQSGGNLATLKQQAENRAERSDGKGSEALEKCISSFDELSALSEELDGFLDGYGHLYICAVLLQAYIDRGGRVATLKRFVNNSSGGGDKSERNDEDDYKEFALLKEISDEFLKDSRLRRGLEQFPDDPSLIEAYLRKGGNFPALVREIADVIEMPEFESYLRTVMSDFVKNATAEKVSIISVNVTDNSSTPRATLLPPNLMQASSSILSVHVLPHIIEKAKASLMRRKLKEVEEMWNTNEGKYLVKTMRHQDHESQPLPPDPAERNLITRIYISRRGPSSTSASTISAITGKKRGRLWNAPKPFEIKRSHLPTTKPQYPFSRNRDIRISALTEEHILGVEKRQRSQLDMMRRTLKIDDFQKKWHLVITSPRGSFVSVSSQNPDDLPVATLQFPVPAMETPAIKDRKSRRQRQRQKMRAIKHDTKRSGKTSPSLSPRSSTSSLLALPDPETASSEARPFPDAQIGSEENDDACDDFLKKEEPHEDVAGAVDDKNKSFDITTRTSDEPEASHLDKRNTTYATAFGPKVSSVSFSSIASARKLVSMRDNPETLVASLTAKHKVFSKSDSNLTLARKREIKAPFAISSEKIREKIEAKKRMHAFLSTARNSSLKETEDPPQEEKLNYEHHVVDILKHYCIIREDRLPLYKRIFEKYVIVKSLRDREHMLSEEKAKKADKQQEIGGFEDVAADVFAMEGSTKFELGRTRFLLEKVRENVEEAQMQIAAAKGEVNRTVARVARRIFHDIIQAAKERRRRFNSGRKRHILKVDESAVETYATAVAGNQRRDPLPAIARNDGDEDQDGFTDNQVLLLLTPRMRRQCEAQVEVRDRKVTLVYLREKAKRLLERQRTLAENCGRLAKQLEIEEVEKGIKRKNMESFTRKQSAVFQALHPVENHVIDECDLTSALAEIDPALKFVDNLQFLDGLPHDDGIDLRIFCVLAALHEKKQDMRLFHGTSLDLKVKTCRDHYSKLLGPNLDVVQVDLAAAGISDRHQHQILEKLTRGNSGRLDFIDFVTYVPLFVDIHQRIVANPLPV